MISSTEIAWAAGFFEGEGTFSADNGQLCAMQVQREPLDRTARILGGSVGGPYGPYPQRPTHSAFFHWRCSGPDAVGVVMTLYSFFSPRRKQQAAAWLDAWRARGKHGGRRAKAA